MNPLVIIGAVAGAAYVYKKKPEILPKFLQPKDHAKKVAALGAVTATSAPTPSALHGLDANMTSAEVASANGLLSNGTDPSALYAMASDYSERGHVETAKALIAKADAISAAKKHGADDDEVFKQMMAATTAGEAGSAVPGIGTPGTKVWG
jgi:hypothetical protein